MTTAVAAGAEKVWIPLESNPEVLNEYLIKCGVPKTYGCHEVFGTDEELLALVPQPSLALLLLFPISEKTEARRIEQLSLPTSKHAQEAYFMKQLVANACGTVGLMHAIANNQHNFTLVPGSFLEKFLHSTKSLDPEERGLALEKDEEIEAIHEEAAQEGQSNVPTRTDDVDLHFVAFVPITHEGETHILEFDGRKHGPIDHGKTTHETFLKDAVKVIKDEFISLVDNIRFTIMSFGKVDDEDADDDSDSNSENHIDTEQHPHHHPANNHTTTTTAANNNNNNNNQHQQQHPGLDSSSEPQH